MDWFPGSSMSSLLLNAHHLSLLIFGPCLLCFVLSFLQHHITLFIKILHSPKTPMPYLAIQFQLIPQSDPLTPQGQGQPVPCLSMKQL
jgi:hypothetical protein